MAKFAYLKVKLPKSVAKEAERVFKSRGMTLKQALERFAGLSVKKEQAADLVDPRFSDKELFFKAIEENDAKKVEELIEEVVNVKTVRKNGESPLVFAMGCRARIYEYDENTEAEIIEVCKVLLKHGADINAVNSAGETPLIKSMEAFTCNPNIVKFLLKNGADATVCDKEGNSSL